MKRYLKTALTLAIVCFFTKISVAQIAAWELNGNNGDETTVAATTLNGNLAATSISRGGGVSPSALGNAFSSSNWSTGSLSSTDYYQFTIQANSGYQVSLSTLDVNFRRSSTGPNTFQWQYSLNGFSTTGTNIGSAISYTATSTNGTAQTQISLSSISALQNVGSSTTITFRLYGYSAGASGGTFAIGRLSGNDLAIGGSVTAVASCSSPTKLLFTSQPTTTVQNATIPSFTVAVSCANNSTMTGCNNGTVTLAFSGCGISGTLSKSVVNGVATFNNLSVSRSAQNNVTFTATYSGSCGSSLTLATSSTFNITSPVRAATTIASHTFDGTNTWTSYTPSVGGSGMFNTSNTAGVSSSSCMAYYYDDCLTGSSGSSSSVIFSKSSLSSYSNLNFKFRLSAGGPQLAGASCSTGEGVDVDDYIKLETRVDGGAWQTTFNMDGYGNYTYAWNSNALSLSYNANSTVDINSEPSVFTVSLPSSVSSVDFRFTLKTNRRHELWYLDNVNLEGSLPGTPSPLPTVNAGNNYAGCYGGPNALSASSSNTVGSVAYSWSPSGSLTNATTANPTASNTVATSYTVTITDGDGCTATDNVTVSLLSGTAGLWTGALNDDWFNCKNWADGRVPTSATDVQIPNVTRKPNISSAGALAHNITIQSGSDLVMDDATSELQVYGGITNNSGSSLSLSGVAGATINFKGTGSFSINGSNPITFQRLLINKQNTTDNITIASNSQVTELLQIFKGKCSINNSTIVDAKKVDINSNNGSINVSTTAILRVNN